MGFQYAGIFHKMKGPMTLSKNQEDLIRSEMDLLCEPDVSGLPCVPCGPPEAPLHSYILPPCKIRIHSRSRGT